MFRCPTCIAVLPDPRAHRCTVCGQNLRRRLPKLLGSASPQVWATPTLRARSAAMPAHEPPAAPVPAAPAVEAPPVPSDATPFAPAFAVTAPKPHPPAAPEPVLRIDPESVVIPPADPERPLVPPATLADSLREAVVRAEHDGDHRHARVATQERIEGPWLTDLRRAWDPPDPTLQTYSRRRRWWHGVRQWLG